MLKKAKKILLKLLQRCQINLKQQHKKKVKLIKLKVMSLK